MFFDDNGYNIKDNNSRDILLNIFVIYLNIWNVSIKDFR